MVVSSCPGRVYSSEKWTAHGFGTLSGKKIWTTSLLMEQRSDKGTAVWTVKESKSIPDFWQTEKPVLGAWAHCRCSALTHSWVQNCQVLAWWWALLGLFERALWKSLKGWCLILYSRSWLFFRVWQDHATAERAYIFGSKLETFMEFQKFSLFLAT